MISNSVEVIPQSSALGAEIRGVDLSQPLDDATFAAIHRAFLEHQVIFIRGQDITPQQQLDFAARFGTPNDYPMTIGLPECPKVTVVVKEPHEVMNFGGDWHSDTTYLKDPPAVTVLYAREVPPVGGDTLFANMYLAYESLSEGMRALVDTLIGVNTSGLALRNRIKRGTNTSIKNSAVTEEMRAEHPVARLVPETGRKALYVNQGHTVQFKDMTPEESAPLVKFLSQHAVRPEYTFRLRWEKGTITVWDNRCTQHYAMNDYHGHRRLMHRVTVAGDRSRPTLKAVS